MQRNEASETAAGVRQMEWPTGVRCSVREFHREPEGWVVAVGLRGCGDARTVVTLAVPLCPYTRIALAAHAADVADRSASESLCFGIGRPPVAPTTVGAPDDDEPEPYPAWLAETLARIELCPGVSDGARSLAMKVVRGLEFDDIPVPHVRPFVGKSIVLKWTHEARELEVCFNDANSWVSSLSEPGVTNSGWTFRRGDADFAGFSAIRNAVRWCFKLIPPDDINLFDLCRVRRKRGAA